MGKKRSKHRNSIIREQNGKCFYCHLPFRGDLTFEHLRSRSEGGGDTRINLRLAHMKCNSRVGNIPVAEKLRLHYIGYFEGSDAFFRALDEVVEANKPPRNPDSEVASHIKGETAATKKQRAWKRYVEAQAARARLGPVAELFQEPVRPQ